MPSRIIALITGFILLFTQAGFSQDLSLEDLNIHYKRTNTVGMSILTGWAGANIITGTIFTITERGEQRYFHMMNLGWGVVNGLLGGFGLHTALRKTPTNMPFADSYQRFHNTQKMFLVNGGIDVGYIATGLYMWELSKRGGAASDMLSGFGQSFVLQGSFLLAFDFIMFFAHLKAGKHFHRILSSVNISSNGLGLKIMF